MQTTLVLQPIRELLNVDSAANKIQDGRIKKRLWRSHSLTEMTARRRYGRYGPIVGSIDQGTHNARFLAFSAETSEILTYHQVEIEQIYPQDGWVEQDPLAILRAVEECIEKTTQNLKQLEIDPGDMVAVGLTNQRETTILWDKVTGLPLHNAIVWLDTRTSKTVDDILSQVRHKNSEILKPLCGLPINPYFSALKIKWLIDNICDVQKAIDDGRCLFGTLDSWLIWNLTGGVSGGIHVTDVTNASRTMLMNILSLSWDDRLLSFFAIPRAILPDIYSSSEIYGYIRQGALQGVPISGCLGDQQSALVGQMCLNKGQIKTFYGAGGFLLCNTGTCVVESRHGLLTTVAYQLGQTAAPVYALEGPIAHAGSAFKWLRDQMNLINDLDDVEKISCDQQSDVTFVPAFSGLFAPYWNKDAGSVLCGLDHNTTKADLVRAAMEAVCFQTKDMLDALKVDFDRPIQKIFADGGMTVNACFMQLQADIAGIPIVRASISESTALGAAIVAGMADGVKVWDILKAPKVIYDTFYPSITDDDRDIRCKRWKMAVARSQDWKLPPKPPKNWKASQLFSNTAPGLFLVLSLATLIIAKQWQTSLSS